MGSNASNMFRSLLVFVCLVLSIAAQSQTSSQTALPNKGVADLQWFSGRWSCDGKFIGSGKAISADLSFDPTLDGKWILFRHDDRPPFSYHALSEWGWDEKGQQYVSTVQDSTGGIRSFYSKGFSDSKLIWEGRALGSPNTSTPTAPAERFEFAKNSGDTFTVTYSFQKDGQWQQVDTSVCSRGPATPTAPASAAAAPAVAPPAVKENSLLLTAVPYHDPVSFSLEDFRALPHVTIAVHNSHSNADESYSGVLLEALLAKVNAPVGQQLRKDALTSYLVASGSDGYSVLLSLAEVDSSFHQGQVLVADTHDGQPLAKSGSFQLIVTDDKRPARWVRNLISITLLRAH